jgi:hypothetical protein
MQNARLCNFNKKCADSMASMVASLMAQGVHKMLRPMRDSGTLGFVSEVDFISVWNHMRRVVPSIVDAEESYKDERSKVGNDILSSYMKTVAFGMRYLMHHKSDVSLVFPTRDADTLTVEQYKANCAKVEACLEGLTFKAKVSVNRGNQKAIFMDEDLSGISLPSVRGASSSGERTGRPQFREARPTGRVANDVFVEEAW